MKKRIIRNFKFLSNPKTEFAKINKQTLEQSLENHIKLVLISGVLAAVFSFIKYIAIAAYFSWFEGVTVDYIRLANYASSLAGGTFFFYLFAGTFITAAIALILNFFFRRKFVEIIKIVTASLVPVLLFGWIMPVLGLTMLVWSILLFVVGVRKA